MNPIDRAGSAARSVGGYISNVARSVRDVPTALGTALDPKGAQARGQALAELNQTKSKYGLPPVTPGEVKSMSTMPLKNLATQVGQVAGAVVGKKDNSRSSQYYGPNKTYIDSKTDRGFYLNNPSKLGK
jgi:hypothetical protein